MLNKIKIIIDEDEEVFEVGKNGVKSIKIDEKEGLVEITFEEDEEDQELAVVSTGSRIMDRRDKFRRLDNI